MLVWKVDSGKASLLQLALLRTLWRMGSSQLYYSIQEESQQGTFVSHIAQDLGLEVDARVLDVSVGLQGTKEIFLGKCAEWDFVCEFSDWQGEAL